MSLFLKIGVGLSVALLSLSSPMSTFALFMEDGSYSMNLKYRVTGIQDPGKLGGSISENTVYTQANSIIHVIEWLESQQTKCYIDQDGFLVFQGQKLINNSNLICDILDKKETYLSFLRDLRDNKRYTMINNVTLGGIGVLIVYSSGKQDVAPYTLVPYTNAPLISKRAPNKQGVRGIEKTFAGDAPSYSLIRVLVQDGMLVHQQAEIIPYSELYGDEGTNLEQFDSNLKKAVNRGWKFSSKSFQLRYSGIIKAFNREWQLMQ